MILYNNTDNMGNFASWESHSLGQYIAPDTDTGRGERGHTVKNHDDAYRLKNLSLFTVEYDHEVRKTKIMGKSGIFGLFPCRGSTVKQFCFKGCPEKLQKTSILKPLIAK